MYDHLFSEIVVGGRTLKNRLTMAPLYLGYAGEGGTESDVLLEHYRLMAQSGVALLVVENCTVEYSRGSGSVKTLRADTADNLEGLKLLSRTIRQEGALACMQINHAGRFASAAAVPLAPSEVETFGRVPEALDHAGIQRIVGQYAEAAKLCKSAGFDMVELHGGTGYLLAQFLSPRTNLRTDAYGGALQNRQRFALEVVAAVRQAVGDFPVGYRFLADEWMPDGLQLEESRQFARRLADCGIAYISVMGGTYESFRLPQIVERSRQAGYMLDLAAAIKSQVDVPVIAAGRLATGAVAQKALTEQQCDLIGLARVLWTDPQWPRKVRTGREAEIVHCDPDCGDACMRMVMKGRPALCVRWPAEKMKIWKTKFQEAG
jgi:2,4-dienoyl-CoA reductase (NADPH2)